MFQTIEDDHQTKKIHVISHKIDIVDQIVELISIETTIQDGIQADQNFCLKPVPIHTLAIETIPMIDLEILPRIEIEIIPAIRIETIQMIETKDIKTIDHVIILTTDQIIKDQILTTIKIDTTIIHKIEVRTITIDKETILNHHIGITQDIQFLNTNIGATHRNIKDK